MQTTNPPGSDSPVMKKEQMKQQFCRLHQKAKDLGLNDKDFYLLSSLDEIAKANKTPNVICTYAWTTVKITACIVSTLLLVWCLEWPVGNEALVNMYFRLNGYSKDVVSKEPCIVDTFDSITDVFRPPVASCDYCKDVQEVERVSKISQIEFEEKFAYSGRPVVITDAMANWTATNQFDFFFFKNIYSDDSPVLENIDGNCQFFPYRTSFKNLREVFDMDADRVNMVPGSLPWYIGWANCDSSAGNILRQHYDRPYFLPPIAESSKTDWVFMGSPGYGAQLHIDNVRNPSWQAQVKGTKKWILEPPPECYLQCNSYLDIDVRPGDIIVLDTNRWFHSTLNVGKDISICIGSEYD